MGRKNKDGKGSGNLKVMNTIQRQYIPSFVYEDGICGPFVRRSVVSLLDKRMLCFEPSTFPRVHAFAQWLISGVACDKGKGIFSLITKQLIKGTNWQSVL